MGGTGNRREALVGGAIVALLALAVVAAPILAPADPLAQDLGHRLLPPGSVAADGALYVLGTDSLGRDLLSRLLYGGRTSLAVALLTALGAGVVGTVIGLTAGFYRGWWDGLAMRLADVWQAIPYLVLAIALSVVLGPSLPNLILVLILSTWVTFARVVRSEALSLRESDVVLAARVLGAGDARILLRHVLPQVGGSLLALATLIGGSAILFEASLSFLGLGTPRPDPSWGNIVLDGVDVVGIAWWVSFFPGLAILLAVLGLNLLGDWLRDALDPRVQAP